MKKKALVLALLAVAGNASAGQFWSEDKATNGAIIAANALTVLDWAQTRHISNNPDRFHEAGFAQQFIGKHPTTGEVDRYFVKSLVLANGIGYFLPERASFFGLFDWNPKKTLYFSASAWEGYTVNHNYQTGVKLEF
jgi:hypothetical protein